MKSISHLFKKKEVGAVSNDEGRSTNRNTRSPQIHLDLGKGVSGFMPRSMRTLFLAVFFVIALGGFAYRFLIEIPSTDPNIVAIAPKAMAPAITVKNAEPKDLLSTARKLYDDKQIDESITMYNNLLLKTPNDAQLLNDLGMLYLKKKQLAQSETHLKRSIELAPKCVVCLNNFGYLKTIQGKSESAETYFKKAILINNEYLDPYFNLGVLYEKNGDIGRSASAYREYLARAKDKDSAFNMQLKQHLFSILEK